MKPLLHIVTPLNRVDNLPDLAVNLAQVQVAEYFDTHWWVMWNRDIPTTWGFYIQGITVHHISAPSSGLDANGQPAYGHSQRAAALDLITEGWVWVLDDDNLMHPAMPARLAELIAADPESGAFVVAQLRADGRILTPHPMNLRPEMVDTAQYILRRDIIGAERIREVHADDGAFVARVYAAHPARFRFIDEQLAYWNWLTYEQARQEQAEAQA